MPICTGEKRARVGYLHSIGRRENLKVVLEGSNMDFSLISKTIIELHGSIHSIDQVVSGRRLVEAIETPQD